MAIPYSTRTAMAGIPELALKNRPKLTMEEIHTEFATIVRTPLKDAFDCIQRVSRSTLRLTFRDVGTMEAVTFVGLTVRGHVLALQPIHSRKWVTVNRLPYGTPREAVDVALRQFGPISRIRADAVNGISNGDFSVLMEVRSAIPCRVFINGHSAYTRYRGQKQTCYRCGKEGHVVQACPKSQRAADPPSASVSDPGLDSASTPVWVTSGPARGPALPGSSQASSFASVVAGVSSNSPPSTSAQASTTASTSVGSGALPDDFPAFQPPIPAQASSGVPGTTPVVTPVPMDVTITLPPPAVPPAAPPAAAIVPPIALPPAVIVPPTVVVPDVDADPPTKRLRTTPPAKAQASSPSAASTIPSAGTAERAALFLAMPRLDTSSSDSSSSSDDEDTTVPASQSSDQLRIDTEDDSEAKARPTCTDSPPSRSRSPDRKRDDSTRSRTPTRPAPVPSGRRKSRSPGPLGGLPYFGALAKDKETVFFDANDDESTNTDRLVNTQGDLVNQSDTPPERLAGDQPLGGGLAPS